MTYTRMVGQVHFFLLAMLLVHVVDILQNG